MEVAFRSSEISVFKESFILASGSRFWINYKLCAFIWSFFLLVDTILEIRCKPIFFYFFYSWKRKQFFRLVETDFLSNASFRRVETDFLLSVRLFKANIVLVETIIQIKVKPFMSDCPISGSHFYVFFRYSCRWKPLFRVVETGNVSF